VKLLLDSHVVIWWLREPKLLSARAAQLIEDTSNLVMVSAVTGWEIAIKENVGKSDWLPSLTDLPSLVAAEGFFEVSVSMEHCIRAGLLPLHHRDPFDRLLVAQAQSLNVPIISADSTLDNYDIKRIW
jgi:PIN domain nuclease of toxin-antitoxin system